MKRTIYFLSDGTGISTETLGRMLLTQFNQLNCTSITIPFIINLELAKKALAEIKEEIKQTDERPVVLSTLVDPEIRALFKTVDCFYLDFFEFLLPPLVEEFHLNPKPHIGLTHGVKDDHHYGQRMSAVQYALNYDDGQAPKGYDQADIILLGLSRSGKTPTCLYLALHFGLKAANYPIVEEDMPNIEIPDLLKNYAKKLFGLVIEPERLEAIRQKRRPDSKYASLKQCEFEAKSIRTFFEGKNIPFLNSTYLSVEELATQIMQEAGIHRSKK